MSPTAEQLLQSVLALSVEDRLELTDALLAADPPQPLSEAWLAEIRHRSAQIDAGEAVLSPWSEVKRRVRERTEGRAGG